MPKTVTDHIRGSILSSLGMGDKTPMPDLDELMKTEWSEEFEILMRNRLVMGAFRYGEFNKKNRPTRATIENIKKRADLFLEERNTEYLVDIANLAMKIFEVDDHPDKHFKAEDDKNHTEQK